MTKRCWVSLSLSVASIFPLLAMALAQSNNRQPAAWIAFEREQEIDLALSAAPEHLRAQAGVFVLQKGGYVRVRESRNGFTCLVQRGRDPKTGHLQTVPLCFDAEGTATNLRTLLRTRELAEQGESEAKIEQLIAEEYRTGQLQAPRRPGIVYALSSFLAYDQQTGNTHQVVPPFVLIYAPFATRADLGILPEHQGNSSHPYLINEGKPNAYILVTPNRQPGIYKPETTATMESEHKPLTKAGEIELALSAAPEHLRAQAGVFVLEGGNYAKARESRNGFNCLVGRADNILDPMCLDREGSQTTMQAVMRRSQLSAQGKSWAEINRTLAAELRAGTLKPPRRSGITYMLSQNFHSHDPKTGRREVIFVPHLMFYAPYLKNADIGALPEQVNSLSQPFILSEGDAFAFLIIVPNGEGK